MRLNVREAAAEHLFRPLDRESGPGQRRRRPPSDHEIRVEAVQRDEYPQVLTRVDITHVVEGPVVHSISPNMGTIAGGSAVTIRGVRFAAGAAVTIGGRAATDVDVSDAGTIAAKTPAGVAAGPADVVVVVAVDDQPPAALLAKFGEDEIQFFTINLEGGSSQFHFCAFRQRENGFEDLTACPAGYRLPRAGAVRLADRGEQQIQIARDVGHGADGRSRVVDNRFLLDGDHRRQTEHEIHIRLCHLRDEALRIARQRFHVAALSLGIDRVECERGLAGTGHPGKDGDLPFGNAERDVLEVILASAANLDKLGHIPPFYDCLPGLERRAGKLGAMVLL